VARSELKPPKLFKLRNISAYLQKQKSTCKSRNIPVYLQKLKSNCKCRNIPARAEKHMQKEKIPVEIYLQYTCRNILAIYLQKYIYICNI
jgi:hypothetical protein